MGDRLAALMDRFPVSAQVFHAGALCGIHTLEGDGVTGQLHLVRRGPLEVQHADQRVQVDEPSLLLYPRPLAHRFISDAERGADLACANLRFEGGAGNPIAHALPAFICLPLSRVGGAEPVLSLLFDEAFATRCGREALVNRLFEAVMILVLRQLMESGAVRSGMLAGLGHARLRHALIAMHESPAEDWGLARLADVAGMSRSAFAAQFREVVGVTSGQYLQSWRVRLAQRALHRGQPLKRVALDVGFGSEAALSRAFKAQSGRSPRAWKREVESMRDGR